MFAPEQNMRSFALVITTHLTCGCYKLKLNSYDLGVDIELYDALNRIRFEHPQVKCVVITSAKERMFCSGANIYMLGLNPTRGR